MKKRDDFSTATKQKLASRAGYRCSVPGCGIITIGPSDDSPEAVNNIGMASHISGAIDNPRSPRFDPNMSSEERCSIENGIWTCRSCGTKIDNDTLTYTVERLKEWKVQAEARAKDRLGNQDLTPTEQRDQLIAKVYLNTPLLFLVHFRMTPVLMSKQVKLSDKVYHAFGIPHEDPPFPSLNPVHFEAELVSGKYHVWGTHEGSQYQIQTLAIDNDVLSELFHTPIENLISNASTVSGRQLSVLEWTQVLAGQMADELNRLLDRYASAGSAEIISCVELAKNRAEVIVELRNGKITPKAIEDTKQFSIEMVENLLWLEQRFRELCNLDATQNK
ncbi:MAG: hypothetical protein GY845_02145 [Planctomycetes bacterium]|nr:hypothetical protein [Planctomycetota bacterium]